MSRRNYSAKNDEDLEQALQNGNLITIGTAANEDEKALDSAIPVELELPYFQFNSPIGIDFTKCFSPDIYLLCTEILEKLAELPNVTQDLRYHIENLKNFLVFGKLVDFLNELRSLNLINPPNNENKKIPFDSTLFQIAVNCFGFIIHNTSSSNQLTNWIDLPKLKQYVSNPEDSKAFLKEIKNEISFPSDQVYKSFINRLFFQMIITHLPSKESISYWNEIKTLISLEKHDQIESVLKSRISLQPKLLTPANSLDNSNDIMKKNTGKDKQPKTGENDQFVQEALLLILYLVNDY